MTHKPRLVASDLDGTLLRSDGTASSLTGEVWSSLPARGIETVIVTARPPRWLDHLGDLVCDHGIAICGNGAFVYDVGQRTVLESFGFSAAEAIALVKHLLGTHCDAGAAFETNRGMYRTPAYPDLHAGIEAHSAGVVDCSLDDLPDDVVVGKILLRDGAWQDDAFVSELAATIGERGVLHYSGAAGLAEISAPGVTKAARLAQWCEARGIDAADVWAFGDMPNDTPMLSWAGRGVAVANAHDDLLAIADDTCEMNDADGVARYLTDKLGLAD